ncbi:hypothetical protein L1887_05154 [Cichorium endivia]|nr:hypothetical protein L1887_05154 [Cichorium endivia]
MMGFGGFTLLVIGVVLLLCLSSTYSQFNPADKYFINCGSLSNTSIGNRVFISDNLASSFLSTPQNAFVDTPANSVPSCEYSELYRTARIFTQTSTYTFPTTQNGRYWIRLYFFPFPAGSHHLNSATFSVSTQNHTLLSDFKSDGAQLKEYSVNVTTGDLEITFTPSGSSFAFLNALEIVSVPDSLIAMTQHLYLSLATAVYLDFVNQSLNNNNIRISIGPSAVSAFPDAILNGVEIMKISKSDGSLSGGNIPNSKSGSKKSIGLIVGVIAGVLVVLLVGVVLLCVYKKRKQKQLNQPKIRIPLSTNAISQTMGGKYSNGTTINAGSDFNYRRPFAAIQEATNNFDESWFEMLSGDDISGLLTNNGRGANQ